jgi:hypothetical protein
VADAVIDDHGAPEWWLSRLMKNSHSEQPWLIGRVGRPGTLDERPHVLDELHRLERKHEIVRLLCHERIPPETQCHRLVLKNLLVSRET